MRTGLKVASLALLNASLLACSSGGSDFVNSNTENFTISFAAFLGDPETQDHNLVEFRGTSCSSNQSYSNIGSANSQYEVNDLRFYVSSFSILLDDQSEVEMDLNQSNGQNVDLALIDFEDCNSTELKNQVSGTAAIPETHTVSGFCFSLGMTLGYNHNPFDAAAPPLNIDDLHISQRDGYRFMRLDGVANGNVNFNVHLGSMSCESQGEHISPISSCPYPNTPRYCFSNYDFSNQKLALRVDRILVDTDIGVDEATETDPAKKGCMPLQSDASCSTVIPRFGLDFVFQPQPDFSQTFPKVDVGLEQNRLFQPFTPTP